MQRRRNFWRAISVQWLSPCRRQKTPLRRQRRENERSDSVVDEIIQGRDEDGRKHHEKRWFEALVCVRGHRSIRRFDFYGSGHASATGTRQIGAAEPSTAAESRTGEQGNIAGSTAATGSAKTAEWANSCNARGSQAANNCVHLVDTPGTACGPGEFARAGVIYR